MSDTDDSSTDPGSVGTDPADETGEQKATEELGDAGKKALDVMKSKWQRERDGRKALADELAQLRAAQAGTEQPDPDKIRDEAKAEARAEVLRERALDKVETRAGKLFADPEDARALLAAQVEDFVDDGEVDTDAIDQALAQLLKKKPHLAAQGGKRFQGGGDGGHRGGTEPVDTSPRGLISAGLRHTGK